MTMEHRFVRARLDHFLDGDLPEEERRALEGHLARCDDCLAEVEGLRAVRDGARALPREIAPPHDLWPAIAARIGAAAPPAPELELHPRRARLPRAWVLRIAAGLALVAASSGVTAWLVSGATAPVATLPPATPAPVPPTALAAFAPTEAEYRGAVDALAAQLELRRDQLAPETVATVEANLRIIDAAIAEAKAALEADPANAEIPLQISSVYRKKVELLEYAVRLSARS